MRHVYGLAAVLILFFLSITAARAEEIFYGIDVQLDTLGDAALLMGNITLTRGAATIAVPMDPQFLENHPGADEGKTEMHPGADESVVELHPGADEIVLANHPGAPEKFSFEFCRTNYFSISPNTAISADVRLMSDARSLHNIAMNAARVTYSINLVDVSTGAVLMPLYRVVIGGGATTTAIPNDRIAALYQGAPIASATIMMDVEVENISSSLVGAEGLVLYDNSAAGALAKQQTSQTEIPESQLLISPNPVHAWAQLTYDVPAAGNVRVEIFDLPGKNISRPVDTFLNAGRYTAGFNAENFPAGNYVVAIFLEGKIVASREMAIVK